jgi:NAD(P)-dependent dehydrogenase (short-subunit alcohol dehydrogenase family)
MEKIDIDLSGQVAIVTGGGRGIGRAIALSLAQKGAKVAVVARTEKQLSETVDQIACAGGKALSFTADVTNQQAVEQMVTQVQRQLGAVDLLVNNAGIGGPGGPLWEVEPDQWWHCMDINLRGPFLCNRAVVPGMVARNRGRIITTVSSAGTSPRPYASAYAISKCAAIRLTENLAMEAKEHGVFAFALHPGVVRTAMMEDAAASPNDAKWFGGKFRKALSDGRDVPPERAAELAAFLASGKADTLSGCFIAVSYDVAEMVLRAESIRENSLYTLRLCK